MFHNFLCKYQKLCQESCYIIENLIPPATGTDVEKFKPIYSGILYLLPIFNFNDLYSLTDPFGAQEFFQAFNITEKYFSGFTSLERTYNSVSFQLIHNPAGTVIAQLQFTL